MHRSQTVVRVCAALAALGFGQALLAQRMPRETAVPAAPATVPIDAAGTEVTSTSPAAAAGPAAAVPVTPVPVPLPAPPVVRPFAPRSASADLDVQPRAYQVLARGPRKIRVPLPLGDGDEVMLDLERVEVVGPQARFMRATRAGEWDLAAPRVQLWRGAVEGDPGSTALLAFTPRGAANGFIQRSSGEPITLSPAAGPAGRSLTLLAREGAGVGVPAVAEICGVRAPTGIAASPSEILEYPDSAKPKRELQIVRVALDTDYEFLQLFGGDEEAAAAYIVQLIGAISEIYRRDLGLALQIDFVRLWPEGGEPFGADSLTSFYSYWFFNEDPALYNIIHLLSGRRDLSYGGVAYADDICREFCYGISGLLLGSFAPPPPMSDLGNWDLYVVAHEMGHNLGTYHTHDGYFPPIDECPTGAFARGTIMSYCHTIAGGLLNLDLRFHRRVQWYLRPRTSRRECLISDCNGNGIDDGTDIDAGTSANANGNRFPDECEDCDGDGILDEEEIAAGAPDVNNNRVPDACEQDCNANGIPDTTESNSGDEESGPDRNGNNRPDECEPDCDADGVPDHVQIAADPAGDLDRDGIPDVCQDCDGNGVRDWLDVDKQHFIYVGDGSGVVMEYHNASGVAVAEYGRGTLVSPQAVVIGPDRAVYVSDYARDTVYRVDVGVATRAGRGPAPHPSPDDPLTVEPATAPAAGSALVRPFIRDPSGGLRGPTGLAFRPDGRLLVASHQTNRVLEYSRSGRFLRVLVDAPDGGLSNPRALALGPDGLLYVADDGSSIHQFDPETGTPLGAFVGPGAGGLSSPRDMLFLDDGRLLVSSFDTDSVLAYSPLGDSLGNFSDLFTPTGAWGLARNQRGNVLMVRHHGDIRILEADTAHGRYIRSFIRGLSGLTAPTGIAILPASDKDCDQNGRADRCDLAADPASDADGNGVLDACE